VVGKRIVRTAPRPRRIEATIAVSVPDRHRIASAVASGEGAEASEEEEAISAVADLLIRVQEAVAVLIMVADEEGEKLDTFRAGMTTMTDEEVAEVGPRSGELGVGEAHRAALLPRIPDAITADASLRPALQLLAHAAAHQMRHQDLGPMK